LWFLELAGSVDDASVSCLEDVKISPRYPTLIGTYFRHSTDIGLLHLDNTDIEFRLSETLSDTDNDMDCLLHSDGKILF